MMLSMSSWSLKLCRLPLSILPWTTPTCPALYSHLSFVYSSIMLGLSFWSLNTVPTATTVFPSSLPTSRIFATAASSADRETTTAHVAAGKRVEQCKNKQMCRKGMNSAPPQLPALPQPRLSKCMRSSAMRVLEQVHGMQTHAPYRHLQAPKVRVVGFVHLDGGPSDCTRTSTTLG